MDIFGTLFVSRTVGPQQLFEGVGGLSVGELAPKVVILGHADPGVAELVTDLAGGHCCVIEEAGDGLAQGVADQTVDAGIVADLPPDPSHVGGIAPAAEGVGEHGLHVRGDGQTATSEHGRPLGGSGQF